MNSTSNRIESNKMRLLPIKYKLGEFDVICGRGNDSYAHKGNQCFREIVFSQLKRFKGCQSRWEKTRVISDVIDRVQCLSGNGGFVRLDMENWCYYQISDVLAREKVSQAFRAAIYEESKIARSRNRKNSILLPKNSKTMFDGNFLSKSLMELPIMPVPDYMGSDWKIVPCHQLVNDKRGIVVSHVVSSAEEGDSNSTSSSDIDNDTSTQIHAIFQRNVSTFANPESQGIDHFVSNNVQKHVSYNTDDEGLFEALEVLSKVDDVQDDSSDPFEPYPI